MADCILPEEIILCILILLPVKSILRFRSVCKSWHTLLSSPEFMQKHFHQFSGDAKSQDYIISRTMSNHLMVSLFSIESNGNKARILNLVDLWQYPTRIVGCCKGLLCMRHKQPSGEIFFWNPALNMSKYIRPSGVVFGAYNRVSVGFGYDDDVGDFKVVRILCLHGVDIKAVVEVYSAKSDSWQTIKVSFVFQVLSCANDVIVNGNPCWRAVIPGVRSFYVKCLLWFDVKKLVFRIVPLSEDIMQYSSPLHHLVDWKGSLATIDYLYKNQRVDSIYIWVFDEGKMVWRLDNTFRPIEMKVGNFVRCSDNGKFIGNCIDGKVVMLDLETACVKVIEIDDDKMFPFKIYGYSESLVYIEGMRPVVVKKGGEKRGLRRRHPKTYSASKLEGL